MRVAITEWQQRVSPLFDVSRRLLIGETEGYGKPLSIVESLSLDYLGPTERSLTLKEASVDVVICGAISREYEMALLDQEIELNAFVAGNVADIVLAWQEGLMFKVDRFSMPGCRCQRRRRRHQQFNEENNFL
jgi:predicted Fe-Mo cluster-binding NifX family protein